MKDNLQLFISLLYTLVFIVCGVLIYAIFGKSIEKQLAANQPISKEMQRKAELRNKIAQSKIDYDKVIDGIHVNTGLAYDENFETIRNLCTSCHSAKLITQNRATRQGWSDMIDWMQETQGLGDLGSKEVVILDYLEKHYSPTEVGRRKSLNVDEISWYILEQ